MIQRNKPLDAARSGGRIERSGAF